MFVHRKRRASKREREGARRNWRFYIAESQRCERCCNDVDSRTTHVLSHTISCNPFVWIVDLVNFYIFHIYIYRKGDPLSSRKNGDETRSEEEWNTSKPYRYACQRINLFPGQKKKRVHAKVLSFQYFFFRCALAKWNSCGDFSFDLTSTHTMPLPLRCNCTLLFSFLPLTPHIYTRTQREQMPRCNIITKAHMHIQHCDSISSIDLFPKDITNMDKVFIGL